MDAPNQKLTGAALLEFNAKHADHMTGPEIAYAAGYVNSKQVGSFGQYQKAIMVAAGLALPVSSGRKTTEKEIGAVYTCKLQKSGSISIPRALLATLAGYAKTEGVELYVISDGNQLSVTTYNPDEDEEDEEDEVEEVEEDEDDEETEDVLSYTHREALAV